MRVPDPHCRIGRIRPKLALYRDIENVEELDFYDKAGFVEELIELVRANDGAVGYAIIVTHENGSVTTSRKGISPQCSTLMLGALAYELVSSVLRINDDQLS